MKFLSVGANHYCVINSVSDIKEVAEMESDSEFEEGAIVKRVVVGEVDGVLCAEEYLSCFSCNAKVKEVNEVVGECMKCRSIVKVMAKVVVGGDDGKQCVVTMFNDNVLKMIKNVDGDGLAMILLMAGIHKSYMDARDVVYSIQKK